MKVITFIFKIHKFQPIAESVVKQLSPKGRVLQHMQHQCNFSGEVGSGEEPWTSGGLYGGPGTTFTVHLADVHSAQWSMCTVHRVDVHGSPA